MLDPLRKLARRVGRVLRNRAKPIKGAIAAGLVYLGTAVGLNLDPGLAAIVSGVIFAAVVERVGPIFGYKVNTPVVEVTRAGNVGIGVDASRMRGGRS